MRDAQYHRERRARLAKDAGRAPGKVGRPATQPCGTVAAYKRHQRNGEPSDQACRDAWAAKQREFYRRRKGG